MPNVLVPPARWARWLTNFEGRHGATDLTVVDGALVGRAADGSTFRARLPFDRRHDGDVDDLDLADLSGAAGPPEDWACCWSVAAGSPSPGWLAAA